MAALPAAETRPSGAAGLLVDELSVRGIVRSQGAYVAMVSGPSGQTFTVRAGSKLFDGTVQTITPDAVVIQQQVTDPLSLAEAARGAQTPARPGRGQMMLGRIAPLVTVAACVAALAGPGAATGAASSGVETPQLRAVSSRVDGGVNSIVIEATEPVAYVTSQPDPLTVLVDLRNVTSAGVQVPLTVAPVRGVRVEQSTAADGTPQARVRVDLDRATSHRVRTSRNLIVVDVDADGDHRAGGSHAPRRQRRPGRGRRAPRREPRRPNCGRCARRGQAAKVTVALVGNGELKAATVQEAADLPPRVLLDFAGVSAAPAVPAVLGVNQADVTRVRVARNSVDPLVTRVVVDLKRRLPFRVESGGVEGEELRVIFAAETPAAAPAVEPAAAPTTVAAEPVVTPAAAATPVVTLVAEPTPAAVSEVPAAAPAPTPAELPAMPAPAAATPAQSTPMPAAQNVTPTPQGAAAEPTGSRFTGHPVSLDFQGADLRAVLRTFAEISGLNVVIDPTITGSVDVTLRDVPWDQALDIILKANKLGYYVDGSIVRIAPLGVLADEEAQRRKLADEQALAGELRVFTRPLSYAKAADLIPILTRSALSARGEVQVDPRTNTVIIRDLPDRLTAAAELMATLDLPQPQVEIEARIVQTIARLRPQPGRSVGHQRPGVAGTGQHHAAGLPEHRQHHRPHRHRPGPRPHAHRREPGRGQRHQRARPGARLDQWRPQPRRRSERARSSRARAGCCPRRASRRRTTSRPRSPRASRSRFRRWPTTPSPSPSRTPR